MNLIASIADRVFVALGVHGCVTGQAGRTI